MFRVCGASKGSETAIRASSPASNKIKSSPEFHQLIVVEFSARDNRLRTTYFALARSEHPGCKRISDYYSTWNAASGFRDQSPFSSRYIENRSFADLCKCRETPKIVTLSSSNLPELAPIIRYVLQLLLRLPNASYSPCREIERRHSRLTIRRCLLIIDIYCPRPNGESWNSLRIILDCHINKFGCKYKRILILRI